MLTLNPINPMYLKSQPRHAASLANLPQLGAIRGVEGCRIEGFADLRCLMQGPTELLYGFRGILYSSFILYEDTRRSFW